MSNINHSLYVYIPSIYCNTRHVLTPQCILYRYFSGGVCRSKGMLLNKTVIITEANTGIGRESAIDLTKQQVRVKSRLSDKTISTQL